MRLFRQSDIVAAIILAAFSGSTLNAQITETKLTANDGSIYDYFGYSVALSDNYALVGAYWDDGNAFDSGAAYIYRRENGHWVTDGKLVASDGGDSDHFGYSVSISGSYALVGAHRHDGVGSSAGAAYIYRREAGAWIEEAKLTASDAGWWDYFGYSVSLSDDYALVGAYGAEAGVAYVFKRDGSTWTETAKLSSPGAVAGDDFARAVSISGDYAVLGAWGDDDFGISSGAAYVFERSGDQWNQMQKLTASDAELDDRFGHAVSISGEHILVGAYLDNDNGGGSGSAYIFGLEAEQWVEQTKLSASDGATADFFGSSVCISENVIAIGAFGDDDTGTESGSAYVFRYDGSAWTETSKITASDGAEADRFGHSVAISNNSVMAGAYQDDDHSEDSGAAYVFDGFDLVNLDEPFTYNPDQFILLQNYPNPFNPTTTISYQLPVASHINLSIYNVNGQLSRELVAERVAAGVHEVIWNGLDNVGNPVASGVYFYRMIMQPHGSLQDVSTGAVSGQLQSKRMFLVR